MRIQLLEISELDEQYQTEWKLRILSLNEKDWVVKDLLRWQEKEKADFKKIMKVMRLVGSQERVVDKKHVKKSSNPEHGEVYEMIAAGGKARLFFFYDEQDERLVICTNTFEKGKGSGKKLTAQDAAFRRCADLKTVYEKWKETDDCGERF